MNLILKEFLELDLPTRIFIIADYMVFLLYLISVLYLFFFSFSSMFRMGAKYPKAKKKYRYLVLYIAHGEDTVVDSVKSFLKQDYPQDKYDIVVVADDMSDDIHDKLSKLPIRVLITKLGEYYKTPGIQYAISKLKDEPYDVVVVMEGSDLASDNFLDKVNNAYYSGGMAIQTHRMAKKIKTDVAVLDAISEEINNSIFRRGHVNVGFSAGLVGSGMVFNYEWFCDNIQELSPVGLDKQLETMLIEQAIFIEYLNDVYIKGDKVANTSDFGDQRMLWARSTKDNLKVAMRKLPSAIYHKNYDYCDKLFQWILPSRILLIGTLVVITVLMTLISWNMSFKWWGLLVLLVITFGIAIPDKLVDARFIRAIRSLPIIFITMIVNKFRKKQ